MEGKSISDGLKIGIRHDKNAFIGWVGVQSDRLGELFADRQRNKQTLDRFHRGLFTLVDGTNFNDIVIVFSRIKGISQGLRNGDG